MASPAPSAGPELLAFLNTMETYNETHGVKAIDGDYLATIAKVGSIHWLEKGTWHTSLAMRQKGCLYEV